MRKLFFLAARLVFAVAQGQNAIDWDGKYPWQLCDFQPPARQIGGTHLISLNRGSPLHFAFQMTHAEFLCTKHFNRKVGGCFAAALQQINLLKDECKTCKIPKKRSTGGNLSQTQTALRYADSIRCFMASYKIIPAATDTLKESKSEAMGMRNTASEAFCRAVKTPLSSEPITMATGSRKLH